MQVVYNDFKSSSILLDLDFSVKLAGHGLDVIAWRVDKLNKAASTVSMTNLKRMSVLESLALERPGLAPQVVVESVVDSVTCAGVEEK